MNLQSRFIPWLGRLALIAVLSVATAGAAAAAANVRVETINIQGVPRMSREFVKEDVARSASRPVDIIFRQEISHDDYKHIVTTHQSAIWQTRFINLPIPISFRRSAQWTLVPAMTDYQRMHEGKAGVSSARYIAWVGLRNQETGRTVVFMNTHFVSGAWSDREVEDRQWRRKKWNVHYAKMKSQILAFHKKGVDVVFGGDFNRHQVAEFHPNQVWLANRGIDKIGIVRAPPLAPLGSPSAVKLTRSNIVGGFHSDHDARVVHFELFPPTRQ